MKRSTRVRKEVSYCLDDEPKDYENHVNETVSRKKNRTALSMRLSRTHNQRQNRKNKKPKTEKSGNDLGFEYSSSPEISENSQNVEHTENDQNSVKEGQDDRGFGLTEEVYKDDTGFGFTEEVYKKVEIADAPKVFAKEEYSASNSQQAIDLNPEELNALNKPLSKAQININAANSVYVAPTADSRKKDLEDQ